MNRTLIIVVAVLLVAWLAVAIIGAVIEGLFWLTVVGILLFAGTAMYGYLRHRSHGRSTR
jgi:fatty acid desaturase